MADLFAADLVWCQIIRLLAWKYHDTHRLIAQNADMFRWFLICLTGLASILPPAAVTAGEIRWRVNSLLHPHLFGESARVFAEEVRTVSGGTFQVEVHDQLVLDVNAFEALRSSLVDAVWGSPGHHHREAPSVTLFGGFPFGPGPEGLTEWMVEAGGQEALNELYARHGLISIYCGALPSEGGGWFKSPIVSVEDLDGLAMRSFGYGARTLRKLGVTTFELPSSDIRPAFETGVIDAAEFAMPSIDALLNFPEFAPYLFLPGWQQPSTSLELLVLEKTWLALSKSDREIVLRGCEDSLRWTLDVAASRQEATIEEFRARGVRVLSWSDEILDALRLSWQEVIEEEVREDPDVSVAWKSYLRFVRQEDAAEDGLGQN